MRKKEGAQKGSGISFEEEGDSEEVWIDCMEVEDDAKCLRKLDEQRKKMQRELREVERLSCASKKVQENLVESLQHQLQKRKCAERELGGMRRNAENQRRNWVEGRALHTAVGQNTMADAEMEAELQGLQAGEERRGSNASQTGGSCFEAS